MPRLELTFLYLASGGGCNARGRGSANPRPEPSRLRAVRRYGHSESPANQPPYSHLHFERNRLILLGAKPVDFTAKLFKSHREDVTLNQRAFCRSKISIGVPLATG
jgi:hypothetical protein